MNLILGTVQMGLSYGVNNKSGLIPKDKSIEILSEAFSKGIEYLDTAEVYGNAHSIIGEYHRIFPEKKFKIITKLPKAFDVFNIENTIDKYLKELNIDKINVLMFHDFETYSAFKNRGNLQYLTNNSKVLKIGVSIYSNIHFSVLLEDTDIDVIQLPYNLLDNSKKRGSLMKRAQILGKEIHTRSAFLQGLFFLSDSDNNPVYNELKQYIQKLKMISLNEGISLQKLALNYCYQNDNSNGIIFGVDSINHLKENLECMRDRISDNAIAEINSIDVIEEEMLNPTTWN